MRPDNITETFSLKTILNAPEKADQLERLFGLWRDIESKLGDIAAEDETDQFGLERECDKLIAAQTLIMNTAAKITATTHRDLLFKLALWRWDAPELEGALGEMQRSDAVAYSAFRDLVELTSERSVMTETDKQSSLLREANAA